MRSPLWGSKNLRSLSWTAKSCVFPASTDGVHGVGEADDDLGPRGELGQRAVEEAPGAEVLHPVHREAQGGHRPPGLGGGHGGGQEMLGSEAEQRSLHREQVHRRRAEEAGHEGVRRLVVDLLGAAELAHLAAAHHRDAVAQAHRLHLVVGDVEGGGAQPALELLELVAGQGAELGVEVRQRLVEEEDVRVADHRPGQGHPLPLTSGEGAGLPLQEPLDAEHLRRPLDLAGDALPRRALGLQGEGDVLRHREMGVERVALEDHGDLPRPRRQGVHHPAADEDVAAGLLLQAGDHPEQGGLPAARGPEEDQEFALLDGEVHSIHGGVTDELLAQRLRLDGGHRGSRCR